MPHPPRPNGVRECAFLRWAGTPQEGSRAPTVAQSRSSGKIVDLLIHFISRLDHLGIGLISALADDEIDEFIDDADVRLLDVPLEQRTDAFLSARIADYRLARGVRWQIQVSADAGKTSRVREI